MKDLEFLLELGIIAWNFGVSGVFLTNEYFYSTRMH